MTIAMDNSEKVTGSRHQLSCDHKAKCQPVTISTLPSLKHSQHTMLHLIFVESEQQPRMTVLWPVKSFDVRIKDYFDERGLSCRSSQLSRLPRIMWHYWNQSYSSIDISFRKEWILRNWRAVDVRLRTGTSVG